MWYCVMLSQAMVSLSAWFTHQEGLHQTYLLAEVSSDPFCTNGIISSDLLVGVLKELSFISTLMVIHVGKMGKH